MSEVALESSEKAYKVAKSVALPGVMAYVIGVKNEEEGDKLMHDMNDLAAKVILKRKKKAIIARPPTPT